MKDEYFVVRRGATVIPNSTVADNKISVTALGLLTWTLFMPPGAPLGYREFLGRGAGEKSLRNALRELEDAGYRWRFQTRSPEGMLRTATLVSEQPVNVDEAWALVVELSSNPVEQCLTSDGFQAQNSLSDRADTGAARSDKGKRKPFQVVSSGESPSGTVQRSTVARCTAARSTVPRSAEAQPSKDGYKEPKGSPPDQTEPARDAVVGDVVVEPVGFGLEGLLGPDADGVTDEDWEVLVECLPAAMRSIEPSAVPKVAAALRRRIEAGWQPETIRATLAGNSLPPAGEIRNLAGIVSYRVGQIPVRPPKRRKRPAPRQEPVRFETPERPLALRLRDEARAKGDPDGERSVLWWLEQYPPGERVDATTNQAVSR